MRVALGLLAATATARRLTTHSGPTAWEATAVRVGAGTTVARVAVR